MKFSHLTLLIFLFNILSHCYTSQTNNGAPINCEQSDNCLVESNEITNNSKSNKSNSKLYLFISSFIIGALALLFITFLKPENKKKSHSVVECLSKDQKKFLEWLFYKNLAFSIVGALTFIIFNADMSSFTIIGIVFEIFVAGLLIFPFKEKLDLMPAPVQHETPQTVKLCISGCFSIFLHFFSEIIPLASISCIAGLCAALAQGESYIPGFMGRSLKSQ